MAVYRVFASNVRGFENALYAKHNPGPLNTCFSTPTIQHEGSHPYEAIETLIAQYTGHPAIEGDSRIFYFMDGQGRYIPGWPDPEYPDDEE